MPNERATLFSQIFAVLTQQRTFNPFSVAFSGDSFSGMMGDGGRGGGGGGYTSGTKKYKSRTNVILRQRNKA